MGGSRDRARCRDDKKGIWLAPIYALSRGWVQAMKMLSLAFSLVNVGPIAEGWRPLGCRAAGSGWQSPLSMRCHLWLWDIPEW